MTTIPKTNLYLDNYIYENILFKYIDHKFYYVLVRYQDDISSYKEISFNQLKDILKVFPYPKSNFYLTNIDEYIKDNPYSGIDILRKEDDIKDIHLIYYALYYKDYPYLEKLSKTELIYLVKQIINPDSDYKSNHNYLKYAFEDGKNINEITNLNKDKWHLLAKENISIESWAYFSFLLKNKNINEDDIKYLKDLDKNELNKYDYLLNIKKDNHYIYKLEKLRSYLLKHSLKTGRSISILLNYLYDYIQMSLELNIDYDIYPNNIINSHNNLIHQIRKKEKNNKLELDNKIKNRSKELSKYKYIGDGLEVILPNSSDDFEYEGLHNNNCVSIYAETYGDKLSNIYFIRERKNINKSYITIELNEDNTSVIQAVYKDDIDVFENGYYCLNSLFKNENNNLRDITFIQNWLKHNRKIDISEGGELINKTIKETEYD